jgi:hypothetical protein
MVKVISVKPLTDKNIHVEFSNGLTAEIDIKPYIRGGISDELNDDLLFNSVKLDNISGICWDNGFDFSSDILLEIAAGTLKQVA